MIVNLIDYVPEARYDDVPWTHARIEEAPAATGDWTAIDTFTLAPVDADPTLPASRSFTSTNATLPAGWYRVVWVDDDANESATPPVQNLLPFATAEDFGNRLGLTLTPAEIARASWLLAKASGEIRDELGLAISLVTNDILNRSGTTDERIVLPERPVVSVSSIQLAGVEISDWYLVGNTIVRRGITTVWSGIVDDGYSTYRGFGYESQPLRIVYTHGFPEIPDRVSAITCEMVARVWVNPGSLIQENIGPVQTTYAPYSAPPRGLQLTDSERFALRRLFGSRSGNVWMGG